jgi:hypothetical protein
VSSNAAVPVGSTFLALGLCGESAARRAGGGLESFVGYPEKKAAEDCRTPGRFAQRLDLRRALAVLECGSPLPLLAGTQAASAGYGFDF